MHDKKPKDPATDTAARRVITTHYRATAVQDQAVPTPRFGYWRYLEEGGSGPPTEENPNIEKEK